MIIDTYSLFRFRLPLREPIRVRPRLTIRERKGVLIRIQLGDGRVGWGEAAPLPGFSRESVDDVIRGAGRAMSVLSGLDITAPELDAQVKSREGWELPPSLNFAIGSAIDSAVMSGVQNRDGSVGGGTTVSVTQLLQGNPAAIVDAASVAAAAGFSCLKIKVGRAGIGQELKMVLAVREAVGPDIAIRLDANRAWTMADATTFCDGVEVAGIEFIEEPLEDASSIPQLVVDTGVPVAIDESLVTHSNLIDRGIAAAAVLKPTVLGSTATRRLIEKCLTQSVSPVLSCSYESAVGTFAVATMAAALDGSAAVGLGTHAYLAEDVTAAPVSFATPTVDLESLLLAVMDIDMTKLQEV